MAIYYNEFDPGAAEWLRELMKARVIPEGEVDERDIQDIAPDDLRGHRSVHLFAGVGVWSYALRLAGWPDHRPVWTCSCPCQPFSAAGKGDGFADERHLWPAAFHLLSECRPVVCFGEQVASDDGFAWLDLVQADLESVGYTVGSVVTPAAGYGAPHGRHRIYWVADADGEHDDRTGFGSGNDGGKRQIKKGVCDFKACGLADTQPVGTRQGEQGEAGVGRDRLADGGALGRLADSNGRQSWDGRLQRGGKHGQRTKDRCAGVALGDTSGAGRQERIGVGRVQRDAVEPFTGQGVVGPGPTNGFWADAEWLHCAPEPDYPEGRWRPVEPGTFPLAHGVAGRVGLLRGYGNGICAPQAAAFIKAWLEVSNET